MSYLPRLLEKRIKEAFRHYPVVTILGARQVGKSTLVENLFRGKMSSVVFDPVQDIGGARRDPEFFLQNHPPPLFLDEVQYAPELLPALKRRVDRSKRNGLYVLSGSQNLSVLKNITESLAGRTAVLQLHPMTIREEEGRGTKAGPSFLKHWMQKKGDIAPARFQQPQPGPLFQRLWRGGYPKVTRLPDSMVPNYWESYFRTYVERDIRTVAEVGKLHDFSRFFGLLASLTSQELNHHELGRELGIDRKTALAWTSIAEATYQWMTVPAFSRNAVKRVAGKSKGYFTDTGFAAYLQRISTPAALDSHPSLGSFMETFVVMEIAKIVSAWPLAPKMHHYRTYAGAEVDLILEWNGVLYPMEIKAKANPDFRDTLGFRSLRESFSSERFAPNLIICSAEKIGRMTEDTWTVPWWAL